MVGAFDPDQPLWFGGVGKGLLHLKARPKGVMFAADKKFGLRTAGEEAVGIVSALGVNRQPQSHQSCNSRVAAARAKPHVGAEGEAAEENWQFQIGSHPAQSGANVILLSASIVE